MTLYKNSSIMKFLNVDLIMKFLNVDFDYANETFSFNI